MKQISYLFAISYVFAATASLFSQNFNIQLRDTLDYPDQSLANICGYVQDGREYALVGASKGLSIVDVTDPDNLLEVVQIPGSINAWKEVKVYQHYAYVVSEGGGGVQIVDLSKLPSAALDNHFYTGTGDIEGQLNTIHALHIDLTKGFLYTYGGNFNGVRVHALNPDPYNPVYVGAYDDLGYVHDGYVDNDTLYACHIYSGKLAVVDMRDKQAPQVLGTVETPGLFTHNSWLLDDRKHILTTDEKVPSYLSAYDISAPTDIKELDRFSPNNGRLSWAHNTQVLQDWAITAWYTDGVIIVDASKPDHLVMVGAYDTWPQGTGTGIRGCWGVYPYLPSKNLLATNIHDTNGGKLLVLTPNYQRAVYLNCKILDGCDGTPLEGALIEMTGNGYTATKISDNNGTAKTGLAGSGNVSIAISKPGYVTQTKNITLNTGEIENWELSLEPIAAYSITAKFVTANTGAPISNTTILLVGAIQSYTLKTDSTGQINLPCIFEGNYRVGAWGYLVTDMLVNSDGILSVPLEGPNYYDDFELDLGWSTTSNALSGFWKRGKPIGTFMSSGVASNPGQDITTDNNEQCYVTGNGGGLASQDDVDGGSVSLNSPTIRLSSLDDPILSFYYWFFNIDDDGNSANDGFYVTATSESAIVTLFTQTVSASNWRYSGEIHLKNYPQLKDSIQIQFVAYDNNPGHIVEAALDVLQVSSGTSASLEPAYKAHLLVTPNPSTSDFLLQYNWPKMGHLNLEVYNQLGQLVVEQALEYDSGDSRFGANLPRGIYLVRLCSSGQVSTVQKVVKH